MLLHELGYELGAETVFSGQGTNPDDLITLYDMNCSGDESHISGENNIFSNQ